MNKEFQPSVYPWRTNHNAWDTPKDYEVNPLPSKTIPDQSMPVITILRRYSQGLPLGGNKNPVYYGDEPGIPADWDKWDLSEKMAYKEENLERIKNLQREMQKDYESKKPKGDGPQSPAPSAASPVGDAG